MAPSDLELRVLADALSDAKKELNRAYSGLEAILEMVKIIHSTLDTKELSNLVMDMIENLMGFETFSLLVFDQKQEFLFKDKRNLPEDAFENLLEKVEKNKQRWATDPGKPHSIKESSYGMDILCLPIQSGGQMTGAFCAPRKTIELLTSEDIRVLSLITTQITTAYQNSLLYELAKKLSITDELTKVYNYRYLKSQLQAEMRRAQRYGRPLSLVMVDLDDFKSYNDEFGHVKGDVALLEIAKTIQENCRGVDVVARYGGEEFTLILPETTEEGARNVGERIRKAVDQQRFLSKENRRTERMTVSVGVASYWEGANPNEMIKKADEALYKAKKSGKNQVCLL